MSELLPPSVETVIVPRARDLGGFEVRRALPHAKRQMVGPFIFFDQMGPTRLLPGRGIDVRPHPHIGLATVTYLFDGEILHRDTLGSVQKIRPGAINWMTAGRGIAHSERSDLTWREAGGPMWGIQTWVALPKAHEETDPGFAHHPDATLPIVEEDDARMRVLIGSFAGATSPVATLHETLYVDVQLDAAARFRVPRDAAEDRAIYVADGAISIGGIRFESQQMLLLRAGDEIIVDAADASAARLLLLGGATMDGPRHIWWNFVSSSQDRIDAAKADWKGGAFGQVPGETEFIPLPEGP
ncbi:MAG: pirin [Rhodospirillales bacterium]|jgi:redox-sensitive bicupin YhaK (pirin superfamily)|nr:pirin [Rhodospirillales bacterium]